MLFLSVACASAIADDVLIASGVSNAAYFDTRGLFGNRIVQAIEHNGAVSADETWSANSVHVVYGTLSVLEGVTLTIEPGAVVKFVAGGIVAKGTLVAKGVTFTDIEDDDVGGDTCGDGWTQPITSYSISGVVENDATTSYRCLVSRGTFPVADESASRKLDMRGYFEEGIPGVQEHFGAVSSDETWSANLVHVVYGTLSVLESVTLTIEPGAVVKFVAGGIVAKGTLVANGVTFTDIEDDDVGGDTCGDGWTQPITSYSISGNVEDDATTSYRCSVTHGAFPVAGESISRKLDMRGYFEEGIPGVQEHFGAVSADETWSANSVHVVYGTLSVLEGVTLTIEPGAVVKFVAGGIVAKGTLVAKGVTFTDIDDTSVGGDVRSGAGIPLTSYRVVGNVQADDTTVYACCRNGVSMCDCSSAEGRIQLSERDYQMAFQPEKVPYSTEWDGADRVRVTITAADGSETELVNAGRVASGVVEWNPPCSGFYEARHLTGVSALQGGYCYLEGADIHFSTVFGTNQVWAADRVHVVDGEVTIDERSKLVIEAGAIVKFMPGAFLEVREGGMCVAEGVIFTHINDDSVGGDSLGDGEQPVPENEYRVAGMIRDDEATEYRYGVKYYNGTLVADETWVANRVYVIGGKLMVPKGVVLTIQKGAVVKFTDGSSLVIESGATCEAGGAIFTHIADDTVGGDTNGDEERSGPSFGRYSIVGNVADDDTTDYRYQPAETISGTIGDDTVWSARTLIHVMEDVSIKSGATLTIQPGAIVKFAEGKMLTVSSGATLNAIGTRAQPIVFTSIKDDKWGGDSNDDGDETTPQPGDWVKIGVNGGVASFSNVQILYSSRNETTGAINMNGGRVVFADGVIAHGLRDAFGVESGSCYVTNSVIRDCLVAFRHWTREPIVNCVIYDCGRLTQGGGQHFVNCIFSRISETWEAFGFPQNGTTYRNCCFWNEGGSILTGDENGPQDALSVCGKDGNIWADPKFKDAANGDFRVADDSPCLDAGDTTVAPARDHFGQPRVGAAADIGIYEIMPRYVSSDVDLRASGAVVAESAVMGDEISVMWTVENNGTAAAHEAWRDKVELVSARGEKILLGEKTMRSGLAAGGRINCTGKWTLPTVPEGEYTVLVTVNYARDIFEGVLTANNATQSNPVRIAVPAVEAAEGASCTIAAQGESVLHFLVGVETSGRLVTIRAADGVTAYFGATGVPTATYNIGSARSSGGEICFIVPDGTADLYVRLENGSRNTVQCMVGFSEAKVTVLDASPRTIPYDGTATVRIEGAGLDRVTGIAVCGTDGSVVPCDSWRTEGSGLIVASVDGSALEQGADYRLVLFVGEETVDSERTMSVMREPAKPEVWARMNVPDAVRDGRQYVCSIEYGNNGNADAVAPFLEVALDGEGWLGSEQDGLERKDIVFVGVGASGNAGVLLPGEKRKIEFLYTVGSGKDVLTLRVGEDADVARAAARLALRGEDATDYVEAAELADRIAAGEMTGVYYGYVRDTDGYPVGGYYVTITNESGEIIADAVSDENGHYVTEEVMEADERFDVSVPTLDVDSAVEVLSVDDAPVSVVAINSESGTSESLLSCADGKYRLRGMADGVYAIIAYSGELRAAGSIYVSSGSYYPLRLRLAATGSIHGVFRGSGTEKSPAVVVSGVGIEKIIDISPGGEFDAPGLPTGTYTVMFVGEDKDKYSAVCGLEVTAGSCVECEIERMEIKPEDENVPTANSLCLVNALQRVSLRSSVLLNTAQIDQYLTLLLANRPQRPLGDYNCKHNRDRYDKALAEWKYVSDKLIEAYDVSARIDEINRKLALQWFDAAAAAGGGLLSVGGKLLTLGRGTRLFVSLAPTLADVGTAVANLSEDVEDFKSALEAVMSVLSIVLDAHGMPLAVVEFLTSSPEATKGLLESLKTMDAAGKKALRDFKCLSSDVGVDAISALGEILECASSLIGLVQAVLLYQDRTAWYAERNKLELKQAELSGIVDVRLPPLLQRIDYPLCCPKDDQPMLTVPPVQTNVVQKVVSLDPNEVAGPIGEGDPGTERFMRPGEWMTYTVYFENASNATAGAQEVFVTNPLSKWLDIDSFVMGEVVYANQTDLGLVGLQNGSCEMDLAGTAYRVQSNVMLDKGLSTVGWYLRIVDPTTVTGWPEDPFAGFLMPNDATHCGEGHLTYRIRVREDAPRNVVITNTASIVFDYNEAIETDPFWWNTAGWPLTLGEAVNNEDLDWSTGGAADWLPMWDENAADNLHDAFVTGIANDTNAWLRTTVEGPGSVSFEWCGATASRNTKVQFLVDGSVEAILTGSNDWEKIGIIVYGEGSHTLTWRMQTGRSGASDVDFAAIDCVDWIPAVPSTLAEALNSDLVWNIDGDADWHGVARDSIAGTRESWAVVSGLGDEEYAGVETRVYGSGTLRFDWAVSCEEVYDELVLFVDDKSCKSISGKCGWKFDVVAIEGKCWHTVRWEFVKDEMDMPELVGGNYAMLDNVVWESDDELPMPSVEGDPGATVTGDAEKGFVVKPSEGKTAVEVSIPGGIDAGQVTVEVSPKVASVKPHGAKVKIVSGGADITEYLDIPGTARVDGGGVVAAQLDGVIDLTKATVKKEIVKEALDPAKGAVIELNAANPSLTTSNTRTGLLYTFSEGRTLGGMDKSDSKTGDGKPWSPEIKVKGGNSAFYSIGVGKGE